MPAKKHSHNEKFQLLSQLSEIRIANDVGLPIGLIAHAILYTVDLLELVKIYSKNRTDDAWIMRNILRRLADSNEKEIIYEYVFNELQSTNYINRLRFKKLLEGLLPHMEDIYKREFFSYFFRSRYKVEFRAAIQYAPNIWNQDIQDILLSAYEKCQNPHILLVLINNIDLYSLPIFAQKIWDKNLHPSFKQPLMVRLRGMSYDSIGFLQNIDPANFLNLIYYSNEDIGDKIIENSYKNIPEHLKPFGIWSLGKLGRWELMKIDVQRFIDNPTKTFNGFGDTI